MGKKISGPPHAAMLFVVLVAGLSLHISLNAFDHIELHAGSVEDRPFKTSLAKRLRAKRVAKSLAKLAAEKPVKLSFEPKIVRIPDGFAMLGDLNTEGAPFDLDIFPLAAIKRLSASELREFALGLAQQEIKISWEDRAGKIHKVKRKKYCTPHFCFNRSNAAAGLAMRLALNVVNEGGKSEQKLLALLLGALPESILPAFRGSPATLFDNGRCAEILVLMMNNLESQGSIRVARGASYFVEMLIKPRAEKDVNLITKSLCELLSITREKMSHDRHHNREQRIGVVVGSIIAGFLRYAQEIKDWDEKRLWITLAVLNIVSAASGFFGMIPTALISGAVGGGFAVASVVGLEIYGQHQLPRDLRPNIREIMGQIELEILEATNASNLAEKSA
ncbi:MAG TPA: hypothetical protein VEL47_01975, partial [Myxococcota bacterium]|nr:hypothetical protein [Myxococcota bacterium]